MGRKIKFWAIISIVLGITYSFLSPASAHNGEVAHLPTPYYKNWNHITFCKSPGVGDDWHILEKVNEMDPGFVTGPEFHVDTGIDTCNVTGHRINIFENELDSCTLMSPNPDRDGDPSWIKLDPDLEGNCTGPNKRYSCRAILILLGEHQWDGEGVQGCLSGGINAPNGSDLHQNERTVYNEAYL